MNETCTDDCGINGCGCGWNCECGNIEKIATLEKKVETFSKSVTFLYEALMSDVANPEVSNDIRVYAAHILSLSFGVDASIKIETPTTAETLAATAEAMACLKNVAHAPSLDLVGDTNA